MSIVAYENDSASFSFDYHTVREALRAKIDENRVDQDRALMSWLEEQACSGQKDVLLNVEADSDDSVIISRFRYLLVDLLKEGQGSVFCKVCGRIYTGSDLDIQKDSPLKTGPGIDKKALKQAKKALGLRGTVRVPSSGGSSMLCPHGHELLRTIDWIC